MTGDSQTEYIKFHDTLDLVYRFKGNYCGYLNDLLLPYHARNTFQIDIMVKNSLLYFPKTVNRILTSST